MKRIILSIFALTAISVFTIIASDSSQDTYGCDCTGSPVTIIVCRPANCPGPVQDLDAFLIDDDCNTVVGSCTITSSSNCCTLSTTACSNHKFHVNYGTPFGSVCTTATFTPTSNPYTVNINCTCP